MKLQFNVEPHVHGPQLRVSSYVGDMILRVGYPEGQALVPPLATHRFAASEARRHAPVGHAVFTEHSVTAGATTCFGEEGRGLAFSGPPSP